MNKSKIQKFAVDGHKLLYKQIAQRAYQYGIEEGNVGKADATEVRGRILSPLEKSQRAALIAEINANGYPQTIERVTYIWFNRIVALRFMEVNNYLPSHIRVFSDASGAFKPEILNDVLHLDLPGLDSGKVAEYIESNDTEALYRYLLLTQCNALNSALPVMFERMGGYTEMLLPNNILRQDSVLGHMVSDIPEENWQDAVQIIGWLYQYYNTELKDDTFAQLKKNVKITKERIPAATQLFTPDWIVRYMVENSLGRLWLEGHPNAELHDGWKYYLDEAEQEPEVEAQLAKLREEYRTIKPEEIKVIDPCMGSGHILVYAFDVLMQIYTSAGWDQREAAQSILKNNLFGLDIDDRAAQLAYFAVMMKARQYDRRLLTRGIQPNIYSIRESNGIQAMTIEYFHKNDPKLKADIESIVTEMRDAKEYGSILNITPVDFAGLYARFDEIRNDINMMQMSALDELLPLVKCAELLAQKYDVVVTNPPYMGSGNMGVKLSDYIKKAYPSAKSDLFACFIERGFYFLRNHGFNSMITMESWMFISSFEELRKNLVSQNTITKLLHMPYLGRGGTSLGINFGTAATIIRKIHIKNYISEYQYIRYYETDEDGVPIEFPTENERHVHKKADGFQVIPGAPITYWVSESVLATFGNKTLASYACQKTRISTGDNNLFMRKWHETDFIGINAHNRNWVPCPKGGDYRKWYGNIDLVLDWHNDGAKIKAFKRASLGDPNYFFVKGLTWTKISSVATSFRIVPEGCICDHMGPLLYVFDKNMLEYVLGLMNTNMAYMYLKILAPTIAFESGDLAKMPFIYRESKKEAVIETVHNCIEISKTDWDSYETSWDFKRNPLV